MSWVSRKATLTDFQPVKVVRYEVHAFTKKIFHWKYCNKCGLVTLRNEATTKAIKRGCPVFE